MTPVQGSLASTAEHFVILLVPVLLSRKGLPHSSAWQYYCCTMLQMCSVPCTAAYAVCAAAHERMMQSILTKLAKLKLPLLLLPELPHPRRSPAIAAACW